MAVLLNLQNVENLVFYNKRLQKKLVKHKDCFQQWVIGKRSPMFKSASEKAKLDFLETLDQEDLDIIQNELNDNVIVVNTNYHIANDAQAKIPDIECLLSDHDGFADNFCLTRNNSECFISFWR